MNDYNTDTCLFHPEIICELNHIEWWGYKLIEKLPLCGIIDYEKDFKFILTGNSC